MLQFCSRRNTALVVGAVPKLFVSACNCHAHDRRRAGTDDVEAMKGQLLSTSQGTKGSLLGCNHRIVINSLGIIRRSRDKSYLFQVTPEWEKLFPFLMNPGTLAEHVLELRAP
jgi:hypothetical protein